jgi:four helix bundle protein
MQCQRLQANNQQNSKTRLHSVFHNKFSAQRDIMEKLEYREMMIQRTVMFTVNLDKMLRNLPTCMAKKKLQDQLGRSGSSIGANFAESGPAESRKDFIHKLSVALKEAEETSFWLRCVIAEFPENKDAVALWNECHEFIKILQASVSTARANENPDPGTK